MLFFKQPLKDLFSSIVPKPACRAPCDYVLNHMICDFAKALRWRTVNTQYSPEEISDFFFETTTAAGALISGREAAPAAFSHAGA